MSFAGHLFASSGVFHARVSCLYVSVLCSCALRARFHFAACFLFFFWKAVSIYQFSSFFMLVGGDCRVDGSVLCFA